jgi:hypothetical protein
MADASRPLRIALRPGPRTQQIRGWLRQLLPAAILLVTEPGRSQLEDALELDADAIESPLDLATRVSRLRS